MKFGIIGLGITGGCCRRWLGTKGETFGYDIKGEGSMDEVNKAEVVFVCVNTPFDTKTGRLNAEFIESSVRGLSGSKTVVVCSTVPIGTCALLAESYPQHTIIHNPEFLRAKTAWEDYCNPIRQVVCYTKTEDIKVANKIRAVLPICPDASYIVWSNVSEAIKLSSNLLLAVRISAAQVGMRLTKDEGEQVARILSVDPRIGSYGFDCSEQVGYAGRCLPKDVNAFLRECGNAGIKTDWLEKMDEENERLLALQGKHPDYGWPEILKEKANG